VKYTDIKRKKEARPPTFYELGLTKERKRRRKEAKAEKQPIGQEAAEHTEKKTTAQRRREVLPRGFNKKKERGAWVTG